jgi:hypothetical protein
VGETVEGKFSFGRYVQAVWLFVLIGVGMLVVGVGGLATRGPKSPESALELLPLLGPIALLGAAVLVWCAAQFIARTSELKVAPSGMSWIKGGRRGFSDWTDVREVYRDDSYTVMAGARNSRSEWMRRAHVRIVFKNGTEVIFRQTLSNFDAVAAALQQYAAAAVFPEKSAEIERGGEAVFGRVAISTAGVRIGKTLRPWTEINYAISQGWLIVAPARDDFPIEERKDVALSTIPNYVALFVLLGQVGKPAVHPLLTYPARWRDSVARHL